MRVDNKNPRIIYRDFWDWLFNYREHTLFILVLGIGYVYYLVTPSEITTR